MGNSFRIQREISFAPRTLHTFYTHRHTHLTCSALARCCSYANIVRIINSYFIIDGSTETNLIKNLTSSRCAFFYKIYSRSWNWILLQPDSRVEKSTECIKYCEYAYMRNEILCMQMKFDLMCAGRPFPLPNFNKYSPIIYGLYMRDLSHGQCQNQPTNRPVRIRWTHFHQTSNDKMRYWN